MLIARAAWLKSLLLLLLVFVLGACAENTGGDDASKKDDATKKSTELEAEKAASVPVEAVAASRKPIVASYTGTASLEAEREAQVVAKASGILLNLLVEEGDLVGEGQVLAKLDPVRTALELQRAEASLRKLQNDYKRSTELFNAKLVSSESHDRVRYDLQTQQASYDIAKLEHSYTSIRAPIGGVISQRMVKEGNLIQMHQALFRIDDFDPLLAVLNVPERELRTLKAGLPVALTVDALAEKSFAGTVARVSPVVDPQTGTFRVTTEFKDASGLLKSGMFGRLSVIFDQRQDVLVIPREALMDNDGMTAVFVVVDHKAQRRDISIGLSSGNDVEILEGLVDGEQVITVGRAAVRDGTPVQVLESTR